MRCAGLCARGVRDCVHAVCGTEKACAAPSKNVKLPIQSLDQLYAQVPPQSNAIQQSPATNFTSAAVNLT
eukprot:2008518-Rhodomonas_salina.1